MQTKKFRPPTPRKPRPRVESWHGLVEGSVASGELTKRYTDHIDLPQDINVGSITTEQAGFIPDCLERLIDLLNRGDAAVADCFGPGFDGRWSGQSARLYRKGYLRSGIAPFGEAYTLTPEDWECPCCRRPKSDFARVLPCGRRVGDIVKHHDHAEDLGYVPRFAGGVYICSSCNGAEAAAKSVLASEGECEAWFTFTVEEIAQFVTPRSGEPYEVDLDQAFRLFRLDHRYRRDQADIATNCGVEPTVHPSLLSQGYLRLQAHLREQAPDVRWDHLPLRVLRAFWRRRSLWPNLAGFS
mgnify:CR=1 FL=1